MFFNRKLGVKPLVWLYRRANPDLLHSGRTRYQFATGAVYLFVGCFTSQQHAGVSQGRICSDNFTYCHTEIEVADQTFYLTQSQYTDIGPTSPSTDPIMPGAWQGGHWSANFQVTGMTRPRKNLASGIQIRDLPLSRPLGQRGGSGVVVRRGWGREGEKRKRGRGGGGVVAC